MKPFNLDEFKAGKPAIRRDGKIARFEAFVPDAYESVRLVYSYETELGHRVICLVQDSGIAVQDHGYNSDLVGMAPTTRTAWVNVHENGYARWFKTEDDAKTYRDSCAYTFIACAKIEWEE